MESDIIVPPEDLSLEKQETYLRDQGYLKIKTEG
jgi:hypothetical protein